MATLEKWRIGADKKHKFQVIGSDGGVIPLDRFSGDGVEVIVEEISGTRKKVTIKI